MSNARKSEPERLGSSGEIIMDVRVPIAQPSGGVMPVRDEQTVDAEIRGHFEIVEGVAN